MRVFVTGGSGFVGKRLVARLVQEGHSVLALSRSISTDSMLEEFGCTPVRGDLSDISQWEMALLHVDAVIHCAAPVEFWGAWSKFSSGIVDATKTLVAAAAKRGVKRFIHLSSESVLQASQSLVDIDESFAYPQVTSSFYGEAKKQAEEFLLNCTLPLEIIVLRPPFIWGSSCPSLELISQQVKARQFIWIDKGTHPFEAVHVDNLVEAIQCSLSRGKDRNVYFITDQEQTTVRGFFEPLFAHLNLPKIKHSLPSIILRPVATVLESIWRFLSLKTPPPLTRFTLDFVAQPRRYSAIKSRDELGYKPLLSRKQGMMLIT
jgi:nucleoside-diphosphate-sugar epimerase